MGGRVSKNSSKSYDITPIETTKNVGGRRSPRTLPKVTLPTGASGTSGNDSSNANLENENNSTNDQIEKGKDHNNDAPRSDKAKRFLGAQDKDENVMDSQVMENVVSDKAQESDNSTGESNKSSDLHKDDSDRTGESKSDWNDPSNVKVVDVQCTDVIKGSTDNTAVDNNKSSDLPKEGRIIDGTITSDLSEEEIISSGNIGVLSPRNTAADDSDNCCVKDDVIEERYDNTDYKKFSDSSAEEKITSGDTPREIEAPKINVSDRNDHSGAEEFEAKCNELIDANKEGSDTTTGDSNKSSDSSVEEKTRSENIISAVDPPNVHVSGGNNQDSMNLMDAESKYVTVMTTIDSDNTVVKSNKSSDSFVEEKFPTECMVDPPKDNVTDGNSQSKAAIEDSDKTTVDSSKSSDTSVEEESTRENIISVEDSTKDNVADGSFESCVKMVDVKSSDEIHVNISEFDLPKDNATDGNSQSKTATEGSDNTTVDINISSDTSAKEETNRESTITEVDPLNDNEADGIFERSVKVGDVQFNKVVDISKETSDHSRVDSNKSGDALAEDTITSGTFPNTVNNEIGSSCLEIGKDQLKDDDHKIGDINKSTDALAEERNTSGTIPSAVKDENDSRSLEIDQVQLKDNVQVCESSEKLNLVNIPSGIESSQDNATDGNVIDPHCSDNIGVINKISDTTTIGCNKSCDSLEEEKNSTENISKTINDSKNHSNTETEEVQCNDLIGMKNEDSDNTADDSKKSSDNLVEEEISNATISSSIKPPKDNSNDGNDHYNIKVMNIQCTDATDLSLGHSDTTKADKTQVHESSDEQTKGKDNPSEIDTAKDNVLNILDHVINNAESDLQSDNIEGPTTSSSSSSKKSETSSNPLQNSQVPNWVNEGTFLELLRETNPNFVEIISFTTEPAIAVGENYATPIFRIKIVIKLEDSQNLEISYILKVAPDSQDLVEIHKNFFNVENTVYNEVIPEMEDIYFQQGLNIHFAPKIYKLGEDTLAHHHILLEDLTVKGFRSVNRLDCLDMDHTKAVLRKLAQFHAASASRVLSKGCYADILSPYMNNPLTRTMMQHMIGSFKEPFMDNLDKFENGEEYRKAMNNFFDYVVEKFIYGRQPKPSNFNVLNHGDCWTNNILFKYSQEGEIEDVHFVDFQNTNYGSPAQDLFYLIISSTQIDIKIDQFEHFIYYYHQNLEEHLNLLKYPLDRIPSLRELHKQLIEYGFWATTTASMTMGVVLLDPKEKANFETIIGEEGESMDLKKAMYLNPRYIQHINQLLPWLSNRGFMEIEEMTVETV
ncbi:uncharacterized protein LOC142220485 [Haematobia irritans]|uniref:uncharacterized protein LOC142220485 n=1 Tax=Haematobia irritans TaxID=7368 RepID=UPI003F50846A